MKSFLLFMLPLDVGFEAVASVFWVMDHAVVLPVYSVDVHKIVNSHQVVQIAGSYLYTYPCILG